MRLLDDLNELCNSLKETKEEFNSLTEDIEKLKANKPPVWRV
jgi:peptidoglycan hydrolase CwlO-like protein